MTVYCCHDGLLRAGEVLSGIRAGDCHWSGNRKSVKIHIRRTKTVRSGEGVKITMSDYGGVNAVSLLRQWFDSMGLWKRDNAKLIPSTGARRGEEFNMRKTASIGWLRSVVKGIALTLGLDPSQYSTHSLRAGGATDLFTQRVPYYVIKKKGRWKSEAALVYYRDDEDVEEAVRKAFKQLSKLK